MVGNALKQTEPTVFCLEAMGVAYACTAGAFGAKLELLNGIVDLPRLLLPVFAAMSVLLFRNGQRTSKERSAATAVTDVLLASAAVVGIEFLLSIARPDFVMPRWAPTQGGFVGFCFLTAVRTAFPGGPRTEYRESAISAEEVKWRYFDFARFSKKTLSAALLAAPVLFGIGGVGMHKADSVPRMAGSVLLFLFALWLAGCVWRTAGGSRREGADLETYRRKVSGQRDFLAGTLLGYTTLLLPGCVCMLYGTHVYEFVLIVYLVAFAEVMRRGVLYCVEELRWASLAESTPAGS